MATCAPAERIAGPVPHWISAGVTSFIIHCPGHRHGARHGRQLGSNTRLGQSPDEGLSDIAVANALLPSRSHTILMEKLSIEEFAGRRHVGGVPTLSTRKWLPSRN